MDASGRSIARVRYNNGGTPATVPDYFELDARFACHATKNLELAIVGHNLLHDQHLEAGAASPATPEEIVRAVYGKITWRW